MFAYGGSETYAGDQYALNLVQKSKKLREQISKEKDEKIRNDLLEERKKTVDELKTLQKK